MSYGRSITIVTAKAHGPVRLFVRDDGRVALACEVDGAAWQLPAVDPEGRIAYDLSVGSQPLIEPCVPEPSWAGGNTLDVVRRMWATGYPDVRGSDHIVEE